jgi:phospholipid/cholesterol/gamma-HCH transport system permease protein
MLPPTTLRPALVLFGTESASRSERPAATPKVNLVPDSASTQPARPQPLLAPLAFAGAVGAGTIELAGAVGNASAFLARAAAQLGRRPFRAGLIAEQVHFIGSRSVTIVVLTSAFTGLVLALQGYNALNRFGAEQMVGALVALSLVRELAPVLGALMVTARAGSAIAATLGNMRVTEQIDALKTMAIDPLSYLVAPRLVAAVLVAPMLTALFTLTGLAVAQLFGVGVLGLDHAQFSGSIRDAIEWSDVVEGLSKSLTFALVMVWIATYRGYHAHGGAQGVGQATTRAVVETSVLVLALDYVLTALLF